jgi:hypothetical protein
MIFAIALSLLVVFLAFAFHLCFSSIQEIHFIRANPAPISNCRMDHGFYNKLLATHNMRVLQDRVVKMLADTNAKMNMSLEEIQHMRKIQRHTKVKLEKYMRKTRDHPLGCMIQNIAKAKNYTCFEGDVTLKI